MVILSHRGYWKAAVEKNTRVAFQRSFELGFGTETDLRDFGGKLVISHDPPTADSLLFEDFLSLYQELGNDLPLALNVKSDGLQESAKELLARFNVKEYFFFDMSIPDALSYARKKLVFFSRRSEYELHPDLYDLAKGVWVDMFLSDWVEESDIAPYLSQDKQVCLVSPDLHQRPPEDFWRRVSQWDCALSPSLSLCTDRPEEAKGFFR